jgi:hypothetical protein
VTTHTEFATAQNISIKSEPRNSSPIFALEWDAHHWLVTLRCGRRRLTTPYSKGVGHEGAEPTLDEVLCCLALDANTVESTTSFEEWCSEFGYDSRDVDEVARYKQTYTTCKAQTEKLRKFLGDKAYTALLACEEA